MIVLSSTSSHDLIALDFHTSVEKMLSRMQMDAIMTKLSIFSKNLQNWKRIKTHLNNFTADKLWTRICHFEGENKHEVLVPD